MPVRTEAEKTTVTKMAKTVGEYINADDIKRTTLCSDLEAAVKAEELREKMIEQKKDVTKAYPTVGGCL